MLLAAQAAAAQTLYKRPASFSRDCLPSTTQATTFTAVFPSDFFLSGDATSTSGGTTTVRLHRRQLPSAPLVHSNGSTARRTTQIVHFMS